jgi:hypothetical protein
MLVSTGPWTVRWYRGWHYIVLSTPTFPLVMPPSDLNAKACQNVVEKAKPMHDRTEKEWYQ